MISNIRFLQAGHTRQKKSWILPDSPWNETITFPSSVVVIEHPQHGIILFDTGYSLRFHEVTRRLPEKLYALATPVTVQPEDTAIHQLRELGISVKDVKNVILSHFHADHVAGAGDFTHATYLGSRVEYEWFKKMNRFQQVRHAFLSALLPQDFEHRFKGLALTSIPIPELGEGWFGEDLLGDESLLAVPLPGHTCGQTGLFVRMQNGDRYFLIADAAWSRESFLKNIPPRKLLTHFLMDAPLYQDTLTRLHHLSQNPLASQVKIIPCHCHESLKSLHEI
jgi:glyoxylase-like metal-dependent hydrolase (beta-lactamase superfamily II)